MDAGIGLRELKAIRSDNRPGYAANRTSMTVYNVPPFTEELPWLSESDKELIMGRALCNWIGWELPA